MIMQTRQPRQPRQPLRFGPRWTAWPPVLSSFQLVCNHPLGIPIRLLFTPSSQTIRELAGLRARIVPDCYNLLQFRTCFSSWIAVES
jgi:hypothetical protein